MINLYLQNNQMAGIWRPIFAFLLSVACTLLIGPQVLRVLRKLKLGQTIYQLGPESHQKKQGTITMGGVMFVLVTCIVAAALHIGRYETNDFLLILILLSLLSMIIGFVDDYIKVIKKRNLGLVWWQKLIGQVLIGVAFSAYCYHNPLIGSRIIVPFFNIEWDLGIFYTPLMTFAIVFMTNSANLLDGLDGLLSSCAVIGSAAWGLMALFTSLSAVAGWKPELIANLQNVGVFAMALSGACIGFLRFNRHPAKVFMGDTGSMFIGGATVGMAMLLRMQLYLVLIAFTMVISSLSVILQVSYFKITHGKRIFKMSPIHHHFEKSNMTENQIVAMYSIVTGVLSLAVLFSMILRL